MSLEDAIRLLEQCNELANPWPKDDTRHWIYALGYTRALLASVIADDAIIQHKIVKHSKKQQSYKQSKHS